MPLVIPDEVLQSAHMSEADLRREIAVMLFRDERFTLAQASSFADMERIAFQRLLAERRIPMHYDVDEFRQDLATLQEAGLL
jgi:predicted HTH domain antitoxin